MPFIVSMYREREREMAVEGIAMPIEREKEGWLPFIAYIEGE